MYLLLRYDDDTQTFRTEDCFAFDTGVDFARAFSCDGGVYVFGNNGMHFVDLK